MAAIYLIRHGQASFGKADYDLLSEKGCQQAQFLGEHLGDIVDSRKYYSGDMLRHGQTLSHFNKGANKRDIPWVTHCGFNEFDHLNVLACFDARWQDPVAMSAEFVNQPDANKLLQKQFSAALKRWIDCDQNLDNNEYVETWTQFKTRCINALHDVINQYLLTKYEKDEASEHKDILIFTSGGPIAILIQYVLGLSDEKTLQINQQLRNTSVTKLLFSEKHLSIDFINNYSHLEKLGQDWPTFR